MATHKSMTELVPPARTKRVAKVSPTMGDGDASDDVPSNSLVKLLDVLNLFTPAAPAWSSEELIRSQGLSRSTGYRYIKALSDAGLLAAVSNGHYILGPRIIQLD